MLSSHTDYHTCTDLSRRESAQVQETALDGEAPPRLLGRKRLLSPAPHSHAGVLGSTGTSSRSSNAGDHALLPRRAHSVMALMDFEKLVDDEHAASKSRTFDPSATQRYDFLLCCYWRAVLGVRDADGRAAALPGAE